jgi:hypothetical protein
MMDEVVFDVEHIPDASATCIKRNIKTPCKLQTGRSVPSLQRSGLLSALR